MSGETRLKRVVQMFIGFLFMLAYDSASDGLICSCVFMMKCNLGDRSVYAAPDCKVI